MDIAVGIAIVVVLIASVIAVGALFVWAARRDGEADRVIQRRLGIRRRTRLGR